jgi:serine/threonine protein kinase
VAGGEVEQVYKQYPGWDKMQFEKTYPNKMAQRFSKVQPELANLIEQLLHLNPAKRWSASQCLDHGVFWNRDRPMLPRPQL